MSTRAARSQPPDQALVQQLLGDRRELMVANERLRLEVEEARRRAGGSDPRSNMLEAENRRLRDELAAARAERDRLEQAVRRAVADMERAGQSAAT